MKKDKLRNYMAISTLGAKYFVAKDMKSALKYVNAKLDRSVEWIIALRNFN